MEPDFLAIVDPWVTTLSFVVALAMRIQATKEQKSRVKTLKSLRKFLRSLYVEKNFQNFTTYGT